MFKLRQTWTNILPNATLYRIDKKIKSLLDPAWPITATEPEQTSIHVNPRFLQGVSFHDLHIVSTSNYNAIKSASCSLILEIVKCSKACGNR